MIEVVQAWQQVMNNIQNAAFQAQREPSHIALLAVSKTVPIAVIQQLFAAGQVAFGENYAQELQEKAPLLPQAQWHFIGPLQSNKTRIVAQWASWVHSVDRAKILQRLSSQRPAHFPRLNICLEVNVSGELSKGGVLPQALPDLARKAIQYPNLQLRGLMCIAEATRNKPTLHAQFALLRQLLDALNAQGFTLDTLSMGMTQDLDIAITEGATMVRVGRAIFGNRPPTIKSLR
jgi:pyridoxal phosphate enzyme (YggS family)